MSRKKGILLYAYFFRDEDERKWLEREKEIEHEWNLKQTKSIDSLHVTEIVVNIDFSGDIMNFN